MGDNNNLRRIHGRERTDLGKKPGKIQSLKDDYPGKKYLMTSHSDDRRHHGKDDSRMSASRGYSVSAYDDVNINLDQNSDSWRFVGGEAETDCSVTSASASRKSSLNLKDFTAAYDDKRRLSYNQPKNQPPPTRTDRPRRPTTTNYSSQDSQGWIRKVWPSKDSREIHETHTKKSPTNHRSSVDFNTSPVQNPNTIRTHKISVSSSSTKATSLDNSNGNFIRGGTRRSLQLPANRPSVPSHMFDGQTFEKNDMTRRSFRSTKSRCDVDENGFERTDHRKQLNAGRVSGTGTLPRSHGRNAIKDGEDWIAWNKNNQQVVYGTIGRKSPLKNGPSEGSEANIRDAKSKSHQSTSLRISPKNYDSMNSFENYDSSPENHYDGKYDSRETEEDSFGSLSPTSTISKSRSSIPVFIGHGRTSDGYGTPSRSYSTDKISSFSGDNQNKRQLSRNSSLTASSSSLCSRTRLSPREVIQTPVMSPRMGTVSEDEGEFDGVRISRDKRRTSTSSAANSGKLASFNRTRSLRLPKGSYHKKDFDTFSETSDETPVSETTFFSDVFTNLTSSSPGCRKDGLIDLQCSMQSGGAILNKRDLKRLTEVFTRMFHDPQAKVFSLFMEVLVDFIHTFAEDLQDWIQICLTKLFSKVASDLLGSVQIKVHRALEAARDEFAFDLQFFVISRFINDSNQMNMSNSFKVKDAIIDYLHEMFLSMNPSDFINSETTQSLLNRLIIWSMETKSTDTRKAVQKLIISMFNLNTPAFSLILSKQPKPSQDFIRRVLHSHLRTASNSVEEEDEEEEDEEGTMMHQKMKTSFKRMEQDGNRTVTFADHREHISTSNQRLGTNDQRLGTSHSTSNRRPGIGYYDVEEVRHRQNLDQNRENVNRISEDSGVYFFSDETKDEVSPPIKNSPLALSQTSTITQALEPNYCDYNQNKIVDKMGIKEFSQWSDIVVTFSKQDASEEERKNAMQKLIRTLPDNYKEITICDLKTMLQVLLLTSGGLDEVSELADECISLLLKTQNSTSRVGVLTELANETAFPINLAALKFQFDEIQTMNKQEINNVLSQLVPCLLAAYESDHSRVRKTSLISLVHLYKIQGSSLWNYIGQINENKRNLLMMYFKRASTP